jgi:hypothetical protein
MFGVLGPLNWLIDLIWLSSDANRQALRDKSANTYVVKAKAQAAGQGRIVIRYYEIFFYNFLISRSRVQSRRRCLERKREPAVKYCALAQHCIDCDLLAYAVGTGSCERERQMP